MSKGITTIDDAFAILLSPEEVDALGVTAGAELQIEIVGRALIIRSVEEAQSSANFMNIFESVLNCRRDAYDQLGKGSE